VVRVDAIGVRVGDEERESTEEEEEESVGPEELVLCLRSALVYARSWSRKLSRDHRGFSKVERPNDGN